MKKRTKWPTRKTTTYVYVDPPIDTGNVSILVAEEDNAIVAYPNPFHQRVNIKCNETITAAYITDMMGRREQVRLTAEDTGTYTVLFSDRELSNTYHIVAYPTLFFIDRDGKIAKVHRGYHPTLEAAIEEQLQKMLE